MWVKLNADPLSFTSSSILSRVELKPQLLSQTTHGIELCKLQVFSNSTSISKYYPLEFAFTLGIKIHSWYSSRPHNSVQFCTLVRKAWLTNPGLFFPITRRTLPILPAAFVTFVWLLELAVKR